MDEFVAFVERYPDYAICPYVAFNDSSDWDKSTSRVYMNQLLPRFLTGFHGLRHFYASLLIRHGESVKTVQARLGYASASETLDTYSHLWPDSDDRTRTAVDSVLSADYVRTGEAVDGHNP